MFKTNYCKRDFNSWESAGYDDDCDSTHNTRTDMQPHRIRMSHSFGSRFCCWCWKMARQWKCFRNDITFMSWNVVWIYLNWTIGVECSGVSKQNPQLISPHNHAYHSCISYSSSLTLSLSLSYLFSGCSANTLFPSSVKLECLLTNKWNGTELYICLRQNWNTLKY